MGLGVSSGGDALLDPDGFIGPGNEGEQEREGDEGQQDELGSDHAFSFPACCVQDVIYKAGREGDRWVPETAELKQM